MSNIDVARSWSSQTLVREQDALVYQLPRDAIAQIDQALGFARANGLTVETMEQEDFRIPALARALPDLRHRLDAGRGIVILRGLDAESFSEADAEIVTWGIGNYFGRPIRQGLEKDRRFFTVTDRGAENKDPTRIGATAKISAMHSDNGCLEPRPPCYVGLFCYRQAVSGGESMLISAQTVHDVIADERPDLLPLFFQEYHFRPPHLHVWPAGEPTIIKPILEAHSDELRIHYARVMIEPGMELAETPLNDVQREALDYLDSVLAREDLYFQYQLNDGEMLIFNNLALLHGRKAFTSDHNGGRILKRIWMWRRHIGPGDDPVALDHAEFGLK